MPSRAVTVLSYMEIMSTLAPLAFAVNLWPRVWKDLLARGTRVDKDRVQKRMLGATVCRRRLITSEEIQIVRE